MPSLEYCLGEVRHLSERYRAGGPDTIHAFRDLASFLLTLTIAAPGNTLRLASRPPGEARFVLGGMGGPRDPLRLNDGHYLRLSLTLYLDPEDRHFLKVERAGYQYQMDRAGDRWIFRYDYLRDPPGHYPPAHVQVRGTALEDEALPGSTLLQDIHFPTGRVSLEAVILLLADEFGTPCHEGPEVWRPVLAASEREFLHIAHRPLSGPEAA